MGFSDLIKCPDHPEDWDWGKSVALFFLAGIYAAERVREAQTSMQGRGSNLSLDEISDIFKKSAKYMVGRILKTSSKA